MSQIVPATAIPPLASPALAQSTPAVAPISDAQWAAMQGKSWRADLPCARREELAALTVPYVDFAGVARQGVLIVARREAAKLGAAMGEIFASRQFRIRKITPIDAYGGSDDASMDDDNTSAFNCRPVEGTNRLSKHALGLAIDINPIENPYRDATGTFPKAGISYDSDAKRRADVTGLITRGDVVTRAFARIGWSWGGDFKSMKDYQHFAK